MSPELVRFRLLPFRLPLREPWRFGTHRLVARAGWLVHLRDARNRDGWGEATPLPELGTESTGHCRAWLEERLPQLVRHTAEQALALLPAAPGTAPAARCALETALLDLAARNAGLSLARYLDTGAAAAVEVNAAAGALLELDGARLDAIVAAGYRCIKLKVGLADPARELVRLHELAAALPPGVQLRLDANRAWDPARAAGFLDGLAGLPVESLEEPLAAPDAAALRALQRLSPVPLALDESVAGADPDTLPADRLVLKPMLHGGLLPCMALARRRPALITTTVDGAVATAGTAHLAAAVNGSLAHGLATSHWLASDLAVPPPIRQGRLQLPAGPGLGCVPSAEWLP